MIFHIDKILNQLNLVSVYPNVYDLIPQEEGKIKGYFLWNVIWQMYFSLLAPSLVPLVKL